jgi:hypothetical protein
MKKNVQIVPINSNLSIQKVKGIIALTEKLISASKGKGIILYNSDFHNEQNEIERLIFNFVLTHFWHFISDIKQKLFKNKVESRIFEPSLYERIIKESRKPIEFPYAEHRTRGGGYGIEGWSKMSKSERGQYHNRSSLLDNDLRITILDYLSPSIIGNICYQLADTSIGAVLGIKIKTAGDRVDGFISCN